MLHTLTVYCIHLTGWCCAGWLATQPDSTCFDASIASALQAVHQRVVEAAATVDPSTSDTATEEEPGAEAGEEQSVLTSRPLAVVVEEPEVLSRVDKSSSQSSGADAASARPQSTSTAAAATQVAATDCRLHYLMLPSPLPSK